MSGVGYSRNVLLRSLFATVRADPQPERGRAEVESDRSRSFGDPAPGSAGAAVSCRRSAPGGLGRAAIPPRAAALRARGRRRGDARTARAAVQPAPTGASARGGAGEGATAALPRLRTHAAVRAPGA